MMIEMMIRNVTVYSLIFDNSKLQDMAYHIHYVGLIEITSSLLIVLKGPLRDYAACWFPF